MKQRYVVTLVGGEIAALDHPQEPPASYLATPFPAENALWQVLPTFALDVLVVILGLFQMRTVDLTARWRVVNVVAVFVAAASVLPPLPSGAARIVLATFGGLGIALVMFFWTIVLERSIRRVGPQFSTWVRLFDRRALSEPCALAILRGTLIGLALLGLDAVLVWMGTNYLGMRLDGVTQIFIPAALLLNNPWPIAPAVQNALFQAYVFVLLVGFLASFVARFVRRPWLATLIAAALVAAIAPGPFLNMGAVQPYHLKVLVLFPGLLVLAWTFASFDLLSVASAAFTFAFCWLNYFLLVVFEPTGPVGPWIALGVWGLFVLGTAAIVFQSSIRAARQRLAAAFE